MSQNLHGASSARMPKARAENSTTMSDPFGLPENRKVESEAHTRIPKGQAIRENDHPFRAVYAALKKSGRK